MKSRFLTMAILGLLALSSCTKHEFSSEVTDPNNQNQGNTENTVTQEDINANATKVFGVTFDANHNWTSTTSGMVTISSIPAGVQKVQLLVYMEDGVDEDNDVVTSMKVLNEAEVNGQSSLQLYFDAPSANFGLYAAFISKNDYQLRAVANNAVAYARAKSRAISTAYTLPTGEMKIGAIEDSYASIRGWVPGEKLYMMNDYTPMKMTVADYDSEFKSTFKAMVFSYFQNKAKNLDKVKSSGYYNDKVYPITTGDEPIIISPIYKQDGGATYGNEVLNSDLYYYYFKESDLGSDPVAYLQSLPKYKAFPFDVTGITENNKNNPTPYKQSAFALVYWGDGVPTEGTVGSFTFPKGYKIGFMVRSKTAFEETGANGASNKNEKAIRKQGELYGDGRLNNDINSYKEMNFVSSALGQDGPRMAWLTVNSKLLLCCESGTDQDFNDIIMEVEGGIEGISVIPETEVNAYTYCFEDRDLGDYDMNDVVIKATRSGNTVTYSIVACGAYDELYVRNINSGSITDDAEVHGLFGKQPGTFINTEAGADKLGYVTATKTVAASFSFLDEANQPYLYNKTTDKTIKLSKTGQDPHGIMVPYDIKYPLERVCIKDAFTEFNNWAQNSVTSTNWYTKPTSGKVYDK